MVRKPSLRFSWEGHIFALRSTHSHVRRETLCCHLASLPCRPSCLLNSSSLGLLFRTLQIHTFAPPPWSSTVPVNYTSTPHPAHYRVCFVFEDQNNPKHSIDLRHTPKHTHTHHESRPSPQNRMLLTLCWSGLIDQVASVNYVHTKCRLVSLCPKVSTTALNVLILLFFRGHYELCSLLSLSTPRTL